MKDLTKLELALKHISDGLRLLENTNQDVSTAYDALFSASRKVTALIALSERAEELEPCGVS